METPTAIPHPSAIESINALRNEARAILEQVHLTSEKILDRSAENTEAQLTNSQKALEHLKAIREDAHVLVQRQKDHYAAIEALGLEYFEKIATDAGAAQARIFGERMLAGYQAVITKTTDKTSQAASELQGLLQSLRWRVIGMFGAVMIPICVAVGIFLWGWRLDTAYSIRKLETQKAQMAPTFSALKKTGQRLDVLPCPNDPRGRMCVRIDPNASPFGRRQELAVID